MDLTMTDLDRLIENKINLMNGNGKEQDQDQDPHMKLQSNLPTGVNFAKCENGDCGHVKLQNPKQTTSWKSCPTCKNNVIPKTNDYCFNCGIEDRGSQDFWNDSDVEIGEDN